MVDPLDDTFILIAHTPDLEIFCSGRVCDKIITLTINSKQKTFIDFIFSQRFVTLNLDISNFIESRKDYIFTRFGRLLFGPGLSAPGEMFKIQDSCETCNQKILNLIKEM